MTGARTVFRDEPAGSGGYTVVVAVANPDTVEQLMRTAVDLAAANDGEILAVSVVHKPLTSPFLLFSGDRIREEYQDERSRVLDRAANSADRGSVPVRRHLLVGSDVSEAILEATRAAGGDALLVGWQHRARPTDIVLGTTVDRVVARAPCSVYVERVGATADGVDSILLPTVAGPHLEPAADLVEAVARANDATVTIATYLSPDAGEAERATADDRVRTAAVSLGDVDCDLVIEEASDAAASIVAAAAGHDLVVLGATRERGFLRPVVGSVAEWVAADAEPPVVVAKRRAEPSVVDRILGR